MRFVYIDEAGTSVREPLTVVVGLIVEADRQLMSAAAAVHEALGSVPSEFDNGFLFHAKAVWGSPKYRDRWALPDRLALLRQMMSLPRRLNIPIALGIVRRNSGLVSPNTRILTDAQFHHFMAFAYCVARADKYIREYAGPSEIGTIVAEDVPEMRKFLRKIPKMWHDNPVVLGPDETIPTEQEKTLGYSVQQGDFRVSRIRDSIHFVEKGDDVIVDLADACAFGLRRFFSEQAFGTEFARAIFIKEPNLRDFAGPSSAAVYRWSLMS